MYLFPCASSHNTSCSIKRRIYKISISYHIINMQTNNNNNPDNNNINNKSTYIALEP